MDRVKAPTLDRVSIPLRVTLDGVDTDQWDSGFAGWTWRYSTRHAWRVEPRLDAQDLFQEGYLLFVRLIGRYPEVEDSRELMGLFKASFSNLVIDLSRSRTRSKEIPLTTSDGEDHHESVIDESQDQRILDLEIMIMIEDAPEDIREFALRVLDIDDKKLAREARSRRRGYWRETRVQRLSRLAQRDVDPGFATRFMDWIGATRQVWAPQA